MNKDQLMAALADAAQTDEGRQIILAEACKVIAEVGTDFGQLMIWAIIHGYVERWQVDETQAQFEDLLIS